VKIQIIIIISETYITESYNRIVGAFLL